MPVYSYHFPEGEHHLPRGLVLPVEVAIPDVRAAALAREGSTIPAPVSGYALIDTGATSTGIDSSVLVSLGLKPISSTPITTASGTVDVGVYPAKLLFPGTSMTSLDFEEVLGVTLEGLTLGDHGVVA